jgi:hypothetical protein
MSTNSLLNKKSVRVAFKDKLMQLLVSNHQKDSTVKFSYFIAKNFWLELEKNDIKTLIKYSFFK